MGFVHFFCLIGEEFKKYQSKRSEDCGKYISKMIEVVSKKLGQKHEIELKAFSVLEKMLAEDERK